MEDLANLIRRASRRAILAAPGIDEGVASAIVLAVAAIGPENVWVILDVNEGNCRAGYGNIDGYTILVEKGVAVRTCEGLRVGFVLADDDGFIFGMAPLMVEAPAKLKGCPNAIRATPDQIEALAKATRPVVSTSLHPAPTLPQSALPAAAPRQSMTIGQTYVSKAEVKRIADNIRTNPVRDFDLSRIVSVFTAHIQFVELSVEGANLESHTVKLPQELLTVVRDLKTRNRLSAAFRIVSEDSKVSGNEISKAANSIRKRFTFMNSTYGAVILKANQNSLKAEVKKLEAQLDEHKENVRSKFQREVQKSKKELVAAFWRAVRAAPPHELLKQISGPKPSMDEAKEYLAAKLEKAFPDVDKLCEGMKVTFVTKDVTWETLNSPHFVDWLSKQFSANKEMKQPFEEYRAARQQLDAAVKIA